MTDQTIIITVDVEQLRSLDISDRNQSPVPSLGEKVIYFVLGIPVLIYVVIRFCWM